MADWSGRVRGLGATTRGRRALVLGGLVLLLVVALVVSGLAGGSGGPPARPVPEASGPREGERVSFLAKLVPPPAERPRARGPRVPRSISDLTRRLPLERQVAQLFLVGFRGTDLTADVFRQLDRLDLGGIVIDRANYTGPQVLGQLAGEARVISQRKKHVPPWVMAQQEGGEGNAFPDLPPADAPADIESAAEGGRQAAQAARTLKPLGVSGVLAPDIDVGLAEDPALGARVYSDDPREVAQFAEATVTAYRRAGVFSAVRHFPGLGTAAQPTEEGPAQVGLDLPELRRRDLIPFRAAIRAGTPGVMIGHGLYPIDSFATPASLSRRVATNLLRGELRFRGVAISDDLADPAITAATPVPNAAVSAIRAGVDMLYISGSAGDQQAAYVAVLRAVRRGNISRRRLDEALARILIAKRDYGLIR